nr:MAG TPA: hypothetical protein [Caudoviricetes sp.]
MYYFKKRRKTSKMISISQAGMVAQGVRFLLPVISLSNTNF